MSDDLQALTDLLQLTRSEANMTRKLIIDMQDRIVGQSVRLAAVQARIEALESLLRGHSLL